MRERVCKYQRTTFETSQKIHLSVCGYYRCIHHCAPISHIICDNCQLREPPDEEDSQRVTTLQEDVYATKDLPTRTMEERKNILETYCFACKYLDKEGKICQVCRCTAVIPIDEYAKYQNFHCPLELW